MMRYENPEIFSIIVPIVFLQERLKFKGGRRQKRGAV